MELLKNILNEKIKQKIINNFVISEDTLLKNNIYLELNFKCESILKTKSNEFHITIFKNDKNFTYENNITILENEIENEKIINQKLDLAISNLKYSKSKKWNLPKKNDEILEDKNIKYSNFFDKKFVNDNNIEKFIMEKYEVLKKLILNLNKKKSDLKIEFNSSEFFTTIYKNKLITSYDLEKKSIKNSAYLELILSCKTEKSNFEHVEYVPIENIYKFKYKNYFKKVLKIIIEKSSSIKSENFKGEIILSNTAISDFFNPDLRPNSIIYYLTSKAIYDKISNYKKNTNLLKNVEKDKLNITINSLSKNSINSPYDGLGITSKKIELVKDNKIISFFSSKKYADYTKNKSSGSFGEIEIKKGKKSYKNLIKNDCVEILNFASFVPDEISGDFSCEIRFGYIHKNGKKIPFSGGLFSGNIFELLKNCELSNKTFTTKGFNGPQNIKFTFGEIVGV
jgi:predicted Zn-dependent protease